MKKIAAILLSLAILFCLSACCGNDGEEVGTLFQNDLNNLPSDLPNDTFGELDFEGYWQYGNGYILEFMGDRWYLYDGSGKMLQSGPAEFEDTKAWLMNEDGSSGGGYLYFDDNGDLIESGEVLTRLEEFPYGNSENALSTNVLAGEWQYADQWKYYDDQSIYFDEDGNFVWDWGDNCAIGTYTFDGEEIVFNYNGINGYSAAYFHNDRIFMEGDAGSWYCRK